MNYVEVILQSLVGVICFTMPGLVEGYPVLTGLEFRK